MFLVAEGKSSLVPCSTARPAVTCPPPALHPTPPPLSQGGEKWRKSVPRLFCLHLVFKNTKKEELLIVTVINNLNRVF